MVHNAGRQLLKERIRLSNFKLKELEDERKWLELGLRRNVSEVDYERIVKMTDEKAEFEFATTRERHRGKLQKLMDEQRSNTDNETVVDLDEKKR